MPEPEPEPERAWRDLAMNVRQALALLNYPVPECMPGEPAACTGTCSEHAISYLAALQAVVERKIVHLGRQVAPMVDDIYYATQAELIAEDSCRNPDHIAIARRPDHLL